MGRMPQEHQNGIEITRKGYEGLEFIRQSGVTNMLDRPMVLQLAREWEFGATADWIESVDTRTYGELIFKGPSVIYDEQSTEIEE